MVTVWWMGYWRGFHGDTPIAGWFIMEHPNLKCGTPQFRKPPYHLELIASSGFEAKYRMDFVSGHCRCWSMHVGRCSRRNMVSKNCWKPSYPRSRRKNPVCLGRSFVVSTGTPFTTCKKCLSGLDPEDSICRTSPAQPARLAQIGVVPGGNLRKPRLWSNFI